jgi:hypothetical protein
LLRLQSKSRSSSILIIFPKQKHKVLIRIPASLSSPTCFAELDCCPPSPDIYNQLINDATYLFAWQLTSIGPSVPSLSNVFTACTDFAPWAPRIADVGLNTDVVKTALCQRQECGIDIDAKNIIRHIETHVNEIIVLQILSAWVNREKALPVLCNGFDQGRVRTMLLGSDELIENVCAAGSMSTPNVTGAVPLSQQIIADLQNTSSQIFAWELLATLFNASIVQKVCNEDNAAFRDAVDKTMLKPDTVDAVVCQYQDESPSPAEAKEGISKSSAHLFVQILWNAGTTSAYRDFICAGSETGQLNNVSGYGLLNLGINWQQAEWGLLVLCKG